MIVACLSSSVIPDDVGGDGKDACAYAGGVDGDMPSNDKKWKAR